MSVGFSQTFRLDLDLLAGAIEQYVQDPARSPDSVSETLGIGRRKLDGIHGWLKHFRLRDTRERRLTQLAELMYVADPYLRSRDTHILLHYLLISNPDAEVWYGLFNEFIPQNETFTRADATAYFESGGITSTRLGSDVANLLKMYTVEDTRALADLRLVGERDGHYLLQPMQDIPPVLLAFCLYDYRERYGLEATTSFMRLMTEKGRPGKVFGMTEPELRLALKSVEWEGLITIVQSADIDGIAYTYQGDAINFLRQSYGAD